MIYVIDDDEVMAGCIARVCVDVGEVKTFANAIEAMNEIVETGVPDLIFLDILLDGPDGFTLLNELVSYPDTVKVPVVIVSSLDLAKKDLTGYGVVGILDKATMMPQEIKNYVKRYCK